MKILFTLLLSAIIFFNFTRVFSQIPNSGFEKWDSFPGYLEPSDWQTNNAFSTSSFYPVTRSTDHYPVSTGNYSVRIQNDTSLLPNYEAYGYIMTGYFQEARPVFPVHNHPTSLKGYYKYTPAGKDTMFIGLVLFKNGFNVAFAKMSVSAAVVNWTSFNVILPSYVSADSGTIMMAAYNSTGPKSIPHGNSVLYVDNIDFDTVATRINQTNESFIKFYPNPATSIIYFELNNQISTSARMTVFNNMGKTVLIKEVKRGENSVDLSFLSSGIYFIETYLNGRKSIQRIIKNGL